MKYKKIGILLMVTMIMLSLILNGCGTKDSDTGDSGSTTASSSTVKPSDSEPSEKAPVTLTAVFWGNNDEIAINEAVIKQYMEENKHVTIEYTYTGGDEYPITLQTYFSSNTAPDIIANAGDAVIDFAKAGVYENLRPYVDQYGLEGKISAELLDIFTFDGELSSLPNRFNIPVIGYNKTMFIEAGLPLPSAGWTEEAFIQAALKLTDDTNNQWGFALSWFTEVASRSLYGVPYYDYESMTMNAKDNTAFKDGLAFLTDLIIEHKVAPSPTEAQTIGGGIETGKVGMTFTVGWDIPQLQKVIGDSFEWDIAPLPTNTNYGSWKMPLWVVGFAMSSQSNNKDEAWEFIKYTAIDETAQMMFAQIGVPANNEVTQNPAYLDSFEEGEVPYSKHVFIDAVENGVRHYFTGVWGRINGELGNQIERIINDMTTVEQAAVDVHDKGTDYFSQE